MNVVNSEENCKKVVADYDPEILAKEEEAKLKMLSEKAQALLESNKDLLFTAQVLISVKRLFATAVASLERYLYEADELLTEETCEQLKAIIISSMSHAASKPFELGSFARAANKLIPIFLSEELLYYSKTDELLEQNEQYEEEENEEQPATIGPFERGKVYEVFGDSAADCQVAAKKVAFNVRADGVVLVLDSYSGVRATVVYHNLKCLDVDSNDIRKLFYSSTARVHARDKFDHFIQHNNADVLVIDDLSALGVGDGKESVPKSEYYSVYKFLDRVAKDHNIAIITYRSDNARDEQRVQYSIDEFEQEFKISDV